MFANVFITGASSGLGRGLALHFARAGSTVHAAARRADELARLAAEAPAGKIVPVALDVTDPEALERAIRAAEAASGGALDLVIANAGFSAKTSGRKIDWRTVKDLLDVNVTAACVTLSLALPAMVARGSGTVVAMASMAGFVAPPATGTYAASKAALQKFIDGLRLDLAGTGVKAIVVNPGFVKTPLTAGARHWMPFLMELEDAVRAIAAGVERGKPVVSLPLPMHLLVRFTAALPRVIRDPVLRLTQKR